MPTELASKTCVPCRGGVPPLKGKELADLHRQLPQWAHWKVVNEHHVTRAFSFPDFRQALDFVNRVGEVAEEQGHHPDILLTWGKAEITIWTHKVDGLTESDFIMAAKIDKLSRISWRIPKPPSESASASQSPRLRRARKRLGRETSLPSRFPTQS